jgi:hypothetical protein
MVTYTITLSDAEDKALGYVALSQQDWMENAVKARCENAIQEIFQLEVERKIAAGESITGTKEEIILAANIRSAAERASDPTPDIYGITNIIPDPFV